MHDDADESRAHTQQHLHLHAAAPESQPPQSRTPESEPPSRQEGDPSTAGTDRWTSGCCSGCVVTAGTGLLLSLVIGRLTDGSALDPGALLFAAGLLGIGLWWRRARRKGRSNQ